MTARVARGRPLQRVVVLAARVAAAAVALSACSDRATKRAWAERAPVARLTVPDAPIPAEADVFRTQPGDLAVDTPVLRRPSAHPRTMATYRGLRAYPGAPPRIPHGLTATEYRTTGCRTCHVRGGYSVRFGAYVPVTPHLELVDCLSCHVPDAAVVGVQLASTMADGDCHQCHAPAVRVPLATPLDWRPLAWPEVRRELPNGAPPPVPHDLALRGNCNACHMGPSAVAEIRTTHPERADCRQCHVAGSTDEGAYTRPRGEP